MGFVGDFHIHSRFSRACSSNTDLSLLEKYARIKGVDILGTGDVQHPLWLKELKENLKEKDGLFFTKSSFPFVLQTELSLVYTQDNKGRRVHVVILLPSFTAVDELVKTLLRFGRLDYDGRPIFNIPLPKLVELLRSIDTRIEVIPAHAWTPWFGVLGSMSGFDSLKEAFQDQIKYIHSIETGLSSDPAMNWRIKELDNINLVSFSDCHSYWPWRIGREATVFDFKDLSYDNILKAIRTGIGLKETVEFFPEEGKYHFDGHRKCDICLSPEETKKFKGICPVCKKPLTLGVSYRVEQLADRPEGFKPDNAKSFKSLIPLMELISESTNTSVSSKKNWKIFDGLIDSFDNEFNILLNVPVEDIKRIAGDVLADYIEKNRFQKIKFRPGFDGEYGKPLLDDKSIKSEEKKFRLSSSVQKSVRDF
jgi:uncharacterized protein (TIGR00375 family)